MKRHAILLVTVLAGLMVAQVAFGQAGRPGRSDRPPGSGRQRYQEMTEAEREEFRAQMEERRKRFENMSDEERQKLRAEMSERFGSRPEVMGRDAQLKSIKAIEAQVAKLKAAVEVGAPEDRSRFRELSAEDRAKLREKMMAAMRERQMAIRAIEQELVKLKAPGRRTAEPRARISELRSIQKLAVKEKATQTANRLGKLIAGYQRESQGRMRPPEQRPREGEPRPRRERPVRQEKTE